MNKSTKFIYIILAILILIISGSVLYYYFNNSDKSIISNKDKNLEYSYITPSVGYYYNTILANDSLGYLSQMPLDNNDYDLNIIGEGTSLGVRIKENDNVIKRVSYNIYRDNSQTPLRKGTITNWEIQNVTINDFADLPLGNYVLEFNVETENEDFYYYSNVIISNEIDTYSNLDFVKKFSESAVKDNENDPYTIYMESDPNEDDSTFNKLTIYSNYDLLTWGDLNPTLLTNANIHIRQIQNDTIRCDVYYGVQVDSERGVKNYKVKETYRTRCGENYQFLVDFTRNIDRHLDKTSGRVINSELDLGMVSKSKEIYKSPNEKYVLFTCDNELYSLDTKDSSITKVFGNNLLPDSIYSYNRSDFSFGNIVCLDNGDAYFSISGINHYSDDKGKIGDFIYYYTKSTGKLSLLKFIESNKSITDTIINKVKYLYYEKDRNRITLIKDNNLIQYKLNKGDDKYEILDEGILGDMYAFSNDSTIVAYQKNKNEIIIKNIQTNSNTSITNDDELDIIGFINLDIVFGKRDVLDTGYYESETITPYYEMDICNEEGEILKEYNLDGVYVLDALIEGQNVKMNCLGRNSSQYYSLKTEFLTTSSSYKEKITFEEYYSNLTRTCYKIVVEK